MLIRPAVHLTLVGLVVAFPASVFAQADTNVTGVALGVADWIEAPGPSFGGWGLVAAGGSLDHPAAWTEDGEFLAVPPGAYDLYWYQDEILNPEPLRMGAVEVVAGTTTAFRINTGIALTTADWVPPRAENGWWGAAPVGAGPDEAVNWTYEANTLVLPPGEYDVFYAEDEDRPALLFARVPVGEPFAGIGVEVADETKGVSIVRVLPNGGAATAGLMASDVIIAADGAPLAGLDLAGGVALLRGPVGSSVVLTVVRSGVVAPLDVTVGRGAVEVPDVVTLQYGIVAQLGPGVAPLGPDGSWWAVFRDDDPTARANWSDGDSTRPIVLGPSYYDVYWQPDPAQPAQKVASGLAVGTLVEVPIPAPTPPAAADAAAPPPPTTPSTDRESPKTPPRK